MECDDCGKEILSSDEYYEGRENNDPQTDWILCGDCCEKLQTEYERGNER